LFRGLTGREDAEPSSSVVATRLTCCNDASVQAQTMKNSQIRGYVCFSG
jgi:hypothetical protein